MPTAPGCIGPSYQLADRRSAAQRSVNLYLRAVESPGEPRSLVMDSAPGQSLALALLQPRGSFNADGRWFVVAGLGLHEITNGPTGLSANYLGPISGSGAVGIQTGLDQLCIVAGRDGFVLDLADNTLAQITSEGWRGSSDVDFLDGYFIFSDIETDQFYISEIDNAGALPALDFSSADGETDKIVVQAAFKGELYLFGVRSVEIWVNTGASPFPFQRYGAVATNIGIVGRRALAETIDALVWVGQTDRGPGVVYEMRGHNPKRISTEAVEESLNAAGVDLSLCSMWSYQRNSSEFFGINAPGMSTTWVFDMAMQQWHERAKMVDGEWTPYPGEWVTYFEGTHYAVTDAGIFRLDRDHGQIDDEPLVLERTWPHLAAPSMEPVSFRSLELACTTGNGGAMMLEISNDGGRRWGPPLARHLGATGRDLQRVRWLGLGSARDRVFRMRCANLAPMTLHGAALEAA